MGRIPNEFCDLRSEHRDRIKIHFRIDECTEIVSMAFSKVKLPKKRRIILGAGVLPLILAGLWARRALPERLNAIPASGGESFSMAAIPTPHYLQKDPRWKNDSIGGSGEKLARVGCTVCSLSMALGHYGVGATPGELNDFLKQNDGYTLRGWLKWNTVSNFTSGKVVMEYIGRPRFSRIDATLKTGHPVVVKVLINGIIPHWVLIVGKDDAEYLMRDPLDEAKNVKPLSEYGSKIYAIRTLRARH